MSDNEHTHTIPGTDAALDWLRDYARDKTAASIAKQMGYSATVVRRLLSGTYHADMTNVLEAIRRLRQQVDTAEYRAEATRRADVATRMLGRSAEFVPTETSEQIHRLCLAAVADSTVNCIAGRALCGKTMGLEAFAANPDFAPLTLMVTMPTRPTAFKLGRLLCDAAGVDAPTDDFAAMANLRRVITRNYLVIVDDCDKAIHAGRRGITDVLLWLLDVHKATRCGMILCGDPTFGEALEKIDLLDRIAKSGETLLLPEYPSKAEVRALARQAGLPEPDADTWCVIGAIGREDGLARLCLYMHRARRQAMLQDAAGSWAYFHAARDPQPQQQLTNR